MSAPHRDQYAAAGVDYDVIDAVKRLAVAEARATAGLLGAHGLREVAASRGETAYVVDLGDFYLATVLECLGTKSLVADAMRPHLGRSGYDTIAQDTVAYVVNDLVGVGAQPIVVNAYFAAGSTDWFADGARAEDLVRGWSRACREIGATWGGGESPALAGVVESGRIDLAGSAIGIVRPRGRLVLPELIQPGDAIVVVAASGIHANGLSLARRLADRLPDGYLTRIGDDRSYGEALLDPTPLYSPLVRDVQEASVPIHYLVNVTGHGWRKMMRAERALTYAFDRLPEVPPVLAFLAERLEMSPAEAYGTFNMGAGYAFVVPPDAADTVIAASTRHGLPALLAGRVEPGPRRVVIRPLGVTFEGETLQIR